MNIDDTDARARKVQIEVLRGLDETQRFLQAESLTTEMVRLSRAALREEMPGATEQQVLLRWIELVYGKGLAARLAPFASRLGVPA